MRDPELERKIDEIQELMKIWMHFYKILAAGFSPESISAEREKEFLEIKTTVAERHEDFMHIIESLKAQEDLYIGQNILSLVKRTISLQEFNKLSGVEINKISIEWHDANILLNESLGSLEYKRDELAKVSASQYKMNQTRKKVLETIKKILTSKGFKMLIVLLVLGAIGVGIYMNWARIEETSFYQNVLAKFIEPILNRLPGNE